MLKNIITMFIIFIIWQFPIIISSFDSGIYSNNLIIWFLFTSFIINIMLSYCIFNYIRTNDISNNYMLYFINTYISYCALIIFLFFFNNLFFSFIFSVLSLFFGFYFYLENRKKDKGNSIFILPYLIWLICLSLSCVLFNLC